MRLLPSPLRLLAALLCLLLPLSATAQQGEDIVLGLSQNRVQITANFDGSEILIFGAIKREGPIIAPDADVIVTVAGPSEPLQVMRKERRAGIWVNTDQVTIRSAPSFYAVVSSGPLDRILSATEDLRHRVSIPRAIRYITSQDDVTDEESFVDALIRIRERSGQYMTVEDAVAFDQQTLFRTRIALPANLTEGVYRVNVYMTREAAVVASYETSLRVGKVGLERWLFNLSRESAYAYGVLAIVIAVMAGWIASEIFRLIRNQ